MIKIKCISFITVLLLMSHSSKAQDYNYQFQDTTQAYLSLIDSTRTTISQFDETVKLPIGFSFNYAGKVVDSVSLRSSGALMFDNDNKYNFIFMNKEFLKDTENESSLSSISYAVEADSYNRKIMKIEFKNVFLIRGEERIYFNFQVWLHQFTNAIEFHMGAITGAMPNENYLMGLINMNNTAVASVGYLLQGSPVSPIASIIPALGTLSELTALPATGTVYKFIPAN